MADVLKIGLEKAKPDLDAAEMQGQEEGYEIGYEMAKADYQVIYWCSRCRRRHLSIATHEEKQAAAEMMYIAGWHNPDCRMP